MEGVTCISKLLFFWVTPLMDKGVKGLLGHTDDLYDLPECLNVSNFTNETNKHLLHMVNIIFKSIICVKRNLNKFIFINWQSSEEAMQELPQNSDDSLTVKTIKKISLLKFLHRGCGWQFYSVGIIKLFADLTGFISPLLLNKFVGFIEDSEEPISKGYTYAMLMCVIALLGEILYFVILFFIDY